MGRAYVRFLTISMNIMTEKLGSSQWESVASTCALEEVVPLDRYVLELVSYNRLNEYVADEVVSWNRTCFTRCL